LDQATHGRAFPRWNTHNRQCTVVVDPPRFLLDRGSTISMLAQSCPGIKPSSVWGANWRAQRGLAHRVSTSAPPGQMARSTPRGDRRGGKPSSMWRGQHSSEVCPPRPPSPVVEVGVSIHRSQLMTIEVASPIRSECAVASIRQMHPTGRPNE